MNVSHQHSVPRPNPRSRIRAVNVLAGCLLGSLILLAVPSRHARAKESEATIEKRFKKAISSKATSDQARAFELLRPMKSCRTIELVMSGIKKVAAVRVTLMREQEKCESTFEKCLDKLQDIQDDFDMSSKSSRDMERHNKKTSKIGKTQNEAQQRIKDLENEFSRNDAILQSAIMVASSTLKELKGDELRRALGSLDSGWLQSKKEDDHMRWIHALWDVNKPEVNQALSEAFDNVEKSGTVRASALTALAAHGSGDVLPRAKATLKLAPDAFDMTAAGIAALRRFHDKRCIEPLIEFLKREDLARLREDAHAALASLTGLPHGPYFGPWNAWWVEKGTSFVLPKNPSPHAVEDPSKKGGTFYGISTFSDRVLYVVDISGSMDRVQKKGRSKNKSKMDVAMGELSGAVLSLNPTDRVAIILFNHSVLPWQTKIVTSTEGTKKLFKKWVEKQRPVGGTNIHDALEAGFSLATSVTGRPVVDTMFFLTDGRPTAGKFLDPDRILDRVRAWNETARLRIHAIGIGEDHDAEFMRKLALIGGGKYEAH